MADRSFNRADTARGREIEEELYKSKHKVIFGLSVERALSAIAVMVFWGTLFALGALIAAAICADEGRKAKHHLKEVAAATNQALTGLALIGEKIHKKAWAESERWHIQECMEEARLDHSLIRITFTGVAKYDDPASGKTVLAFTGVNKNVTDLLGATCITKPCRCTTGDANTTLVLHDYNFEVVSLREQGSVTLRDQIFRDGDKIKPKKPTVKKSSPPPPPSGLPEVEGPADSYVLITNHCVTEEFLEGDCLCESPLYVLNDLESPTPCHNWCTDELNVFRAAPESSVEDPGLPQFRYVHHTLLDVDIPDHKWLCEYVPRFEATAPKGHECPWEDYDGCKFCEQADKGINEDDCEKMVDYQEAAMWWKKPTSNVELSDGCKHYLDAFHTKSAQQQHEMLSAIASYRASELATQRGNGGTYSGLTECHAANGDLDSFQEDAVECPDYAGGAADHRVVNDADSEGNECCNGKAAVGGLCAQRPFASETAGRLVKGGHWKKNIGDTSFIWDYADITEDPENLDYSPFDH